MSKTAWLSGFVSRKGETWAVRVECDGAGGTVCADLSADSPLVLEADDDEGLYVPLRETSAKIRYFARPAALPFATGYTTHKVEITRGGVAVWRGWLKPETRTQDLSPAPCVAEAGAAGSLSVLSDIDWDMGPGGTVSLWDLLWTAAARGGSLIGRMVMPKAYMMPGTAVPADPREWLASMSVQAAVFDDGGGDPSSWRDAVEAVCKFLHWTLWDTGAAWVFTDADAWGRDYVAYDAADGEPHPCSTGGGDLLPTSGAAAMPYAGTAHKLDTMPPYGRFTVNPPDGGDGGGEEYEPDFSPFPRYKGGVGYLVVNAPRSGESAEAPTYEAASFYVLDDTTGQRGDVKIETFRYACDYDTMALTPATYGVESLYWPRSGSTCNEWAELAAFWPQSEEAAAGRALSRTVGGVPMLWAGYDYTPAWHGGREKIEPWNPDFEGIVRIVRYVFKDWTGTDNGQSSAHETGKPVTEEVPVARFTVPVGFIPRGKVLDIRGELVLRKICTADEQYAEVTGVRMRVDVQVGSWSYTAGGRDRVNFTVEDAAARNTTATSPIDGSRTWLDGRDNYQGFLQVPTDQMPESGDVVVTFYMPFITTKSRYRGNVICADLRGLSVAFVGKSGNSDGDISIGGTLDSERAADDAEDRGDVSAECWAWGGGEEYPAVDETLTSYDAVRVPSGTCIVMQGGGGAVTSFTHAVLGSGQPEEMLLSRLRRHYGKVRRAWELVLDDAETSPAAAWLCGGRAAACGGWQRDAYAGTLTMRLEEL